MISATCAIAGSTPSLWPARAAAGLPPPAGRGHPRSGRPGPSTSARVIWSQGAGIETVSRLSSMSSRPTVSPSSARRHHSWVCASMMALPLAARSPMAAASPSAARHSSEPARAQGRASLATSGTYHACSGWRSGLGGPVRAAGPSGKSKVEAIDNRAVTSATSAPCPSCRAALASSSRPDLLAVEQPGPRIRPGRRRGRAPRGRAGRVRPARRARSAACRNPVRPPSMSPAARRAAPSRSAAGGLLVVSCPQGREAGRGAFVPVPGQLEQAGVAPGKSARRPARRSRYRTGHRPARPGPHARKHVPRTDAASRTSRAVPDSSATLAPASARTESGTIARAAAGPAPGPVSLPGELRGQERVSRATFRR